MLISQHMGLAIVSSERICSHRCKASLYRMYVIRTLHDLYHRGSLKRYSKEVERAVIKPLGNKGAGKYRLWFICRKRSYNMDIYQDIERATHIPYVDDNATFYRRRQPRMRPPPRRPRNAHLLEESPEDYYSQKECMLEEPRTINPIEIATSIRMAAGTIGCSNEEVEEYWRAKQASSTGEQSAKASETDAALEFVKKTDTFNTSSIKGGGEAVTLTKRNGLINVKEKVQQGSLKEETLLKSCKLHRNAAIKGLIKGHMISIKDLTVPEGTAGCSTQIDQVDPLFENAKGLTFVPSPHDPDILITPLQAYGIDESKHKDIDFTVPRLGTKTTVTPLEYLIYGIDDECFNFVQTKPRRGKK